MDTQIIVIAAVTGINVVLILLLLFRIKNQNNQISVLQDRLKNSETTVEQLQNAVEEIRVGSLGVGKKVKELMGGLDELSDKQQKLAEMDSDSKVYSNAIRLVKSGATIDEVLDECDLPRPEVEMLFDLHGAHFDS